MAVFLQYFFIMKKIYLFAFALGTFIFITGCQSVQAQKNDSAKISKTPTIIYFNPTVFPDIEEIKEPTYSAFFSALAEGLQGNRSYHMLRVDANMAFDSVNTPSVKEYCTHNNATFAVVPNVKYFKVGFGKYVFSNQVVVSMKLYDAQGNLLAETDYDTYKKNARLLGSAENSVKIGTQGAMKLMSKNLRKIK